MFEIEQNLDKKIREIEGDIKDDNFQTRKTEDFCLRLLNIVYPQYHFKNLGYDKSNTEAIDLIDEKFGELGVQVTAQKSNENTKIENTVAKTVKYWKDKGVKVIWILFISETPQIKNIGTIKEYCNENGISFYIKTFNRIKGDINSKPKDDILQIDEFLRQDVNPEYLGISKLSVFKRVEKGENFIKSSFFNLESDIYFSKQELKTINWISENITDGKLKEYFILGNPCSGKTTFAFSIIQKLKNRKVFYLDLSSPQIDKRDLFYELTQISYNYSLVVIDNIHENIELFENIRNKISGFDIVESLYLSRYYKTIDFLNDESIYKIINDTPYYRIDKKENFNEKVSGIIWKKTTRLKETYKQTEWRKGDFNLILKNINQNLLKLNIALKIWENCNNESEPITFDQVNSDKILKYFFDKQDLANLKSDALYTYSLLYKVDIPFILLRNAYSENEMLQEKGIILQFYKSDFFYFPHKEYARLIFDSYDYIEYGISIQKKVDLITNYIHKFDIRENQLRLIFILTKLHFSEESELIDYLLSDIKIKTFLISELEKSDVHFDQVIRVLDILFLHSQKLEDGKLADYYNAFISFFKSNKLNLYIESHYLAYSRLIQISNILKLELNQSEILVVLRKNERATSSSIVELTLRISKKNREAQTILRILNSYDFPNWLKMIIDLPRLSNITNSLSELNTSIESKKLLIGLMRNINWEQQYQKAKSLKIDQFLKSLREIQLIDISLGTNISNELFYNAYNDYYFKKKFNEANLSEYSKAYTDLSKINLPFVKLELLKDLKSNVLFEKFSSEKNIANFTMRAQQLRKYFDNPKYFLGTLNSIVSTDSFCAKITAEKDLNNLLIFSEFAEKYLKYKNTKLQQITSNSITKIVNNLPNKLEALLNPKFLNIDNIDSSFIDSVRGKDIEQFFKSNKITYAEDLFRVLSTIDKDKTIEKFNEINNQVIINSLLNPELNFSQALEDLDKLKNKVYKNEHQNCDQKIREIFNGYLKEYTSDKRRYDRINISDYFKGYYYGSNIDTKTLEIFCKSDFLYKLNSNTHKNFEISPLFQFTRRLSKKYNGSLDDKLLKFLELNSDNFIEAIRKEDITKTLSGLSELALTNFYNFGDELLFKAKNIIVSKVSQRKRDKIFKVKLIPDLKKIAKDKGKIVLKELGK